MILSLHRPFWSVGSNLLQAILNSEDHTARGNNKVAVPILLDLTSFSRAVVSNKSIIFYQISRIYNKLRCICDCLSSMGKWICWGGAKVWGVSWGRVWGGDHNLNVRWAFSFRLQRKPNFSKIHRKLQTGNVPWQQNTHLCYNMWIRLDNEMI